MIKLIKIWLKKNNLDTDTTFYEIEDWKKRNEDYHNESDLVIVTEGGLNFILNWGDPDEFNDLVSSFGYYYELGHSWNLGFYKADEDFVEPTYRTYLEKLKDPRWIKKRDYIKNNANNKCEDCGNINNLQIHHCYYLFSFDPWEYPYDALRCLCRDCHERRGMTEMILRGHLSSLKSDELKSLIKLLESGLYWYPREGIFKLLESFKHDQTEMVENFSELLSKRLSNN